MITFVGEVEVFKEEEELAKFCSVCDNPKTKKNTVKGRKACRQCLNKQARMQPARLNARRRTARKAKPRAENARSKEQLAFDNYQDCLPMAQAFLDEGLRQRGLSEHKIIQEHGTDEYVTESIIMLSRLQRFIARITP